MLEIIDTYPVLVQIQAVVDFDLLLKILTVLNSQVLVDSLIHLGSIFYWCEGIEINSVPAQNYSTKLN